MSLVKLEWLVMDKDGPFFLFPRSQGDGGRMRYGCVGKEQLIVKREMENRYFDFCKVL